jgi:Outer membrane lipoprotein carrier protein LolA-like
MLLAPLAASAATPDVDALVARLARPAPASIRCTEVRFSTLLREPLIVSGELSYSGPTSLDRRVDTPWHETTTIRGDSVKVEREGEPPRSFALRRAPELQGLLAGFTSLLGGDAAAMRRSFDVEVTGTEASWTLVLRPRDARARKRLQQIEVNGSDAEPRCFSILSPPDNSSGAATADAGAASVMLLGELATTQLPKDVTRDALAKLCRAE